MRNMMLGVAGGVAVTLILLSLARLQPEAHAQRPMPESATGPTMLMATATMSDGGQQIVVIDTREKVIGSYHVAATNGEIALKSVRSIRYDFLMEEFNGGEPKPRDIRTLLEQR